MKTDLLSNLTKFIRVLTIPALGVLLSPQTHAAPFINGDIIVLQEDDGSVPASTASSPVFVLEFLPSTANQAGPVQSIVIPTNGATRLTQSSGSSSEGFITRSTDGNNVVFVGYDSGIGVANIPGTTSTTANRLWGQVDLNGNFTRPATGSSTAYSGSNLRSGASDGTSFWFGGTASPTTTEGVWYSPSGTAPWTQISTGTLPNVRVTRIYNGNIYYTQAGSLNTFSGLPTSATAATATGITGTSLYDFAINPAGNVAYVADDSTLSTVGGIAKWTNNGSTWAKAFTFGSSANTASNGLTAGCRGLAVDFSGAHPVIYATTADSLTKVITITDTSSQTATGDSADQATVLTVAPNSSVVYRGVALAPAGNGGNLAPSIAYISPTNLSVNGGATASFTLIGGLGYPTATASWYQVVGSTTNPVSGNGIGLNIPNVATANAGSYFAVLSNSFGSVTSSLANLTVLFKPTISAITPASVSTNAGANVTFTLTFTSGTPAATNAWYKVSGGTTNIILGATNTSLTLKDVLGGDSAGYFAILTNPSGSATSSVANLTVTGDPGILSGPNSTYGLIGGVAQFSVSAAATSPSYSWYFSDTNGNTIRQVHDGTQGSGSVISGSATSLLTIDNLQPTDPTNFVVVVSNAFGTATSGVASLLSVTNHAILTFWNFNQTNFPSLLSSPPPWFGVGTASAFNNSIESGATDPADGPGFGLGVTNFSWATFGYPLNNANPALASNKLCGVQYLVSTAGAKNIHVDYDSRVSPTASDYERLQYTTNGTTWIDYPASSSFVGNAGSGNAGYYSFHYNLTGFPGVDNNPLFGVRVVTEFQSTATYGITPNTNYLGTANTYGNAGTVTYDLVTFSGDAITNNDAIPMISGIADTNTPDYIPLTVNFQVSDSVTSPDSLVYSATALYSTAVLAAQPVNPGFSFGGSGVNRTLTITPNEIPDEVDAAPILVTAYDPNTGDTVATSFLLTLSSVNLSPTNSLVSLHYTNILANTSITIPFSVSDDRTSASGLTYGVATANSTLVPTNGIVINGQGTANPSVTITPAANQLGAGQIYVTVYDNDTQEPRGTTATIEVVVAPNSNVVAIDYFNYDNSGPLDQIGTNYWGHLTGTVGQLQFNGASGSLPLLYGNGFATVDTLDNTENLQAPLLGAPYLTNSPDVLYMSFLANMDPNKMPNNNGSYFILFNDGSGVTGPYSCRVMAATNGAAPGYYRFGVANVAATAPGAQMFPMDLTAGSNYTVVASVVLSNGFSTLWINPSSASSPSVTDTTAVGTNHYNISDIELRESGANAGSVRVQKLKVGTTFDSVLPSLHVTVANSHAIVTSSDPTLPVMSSTNAAGPYTNAAAGTPFTNSLGSSPMFFKYGN